MNDANDPDRFETVVLPHMDAAYNLARWLTRNDHDAEDLTQMVFVRAFKFYGEFNGGNARAWLLTIVRNTFYTLLRDKQLETDNVEFDESIHNDQENCQYHSSYRIGNNPENIAASNDTNRLINLTLKKLPHTFREIIILKEIENLSYKQIAEVTGIPIGTVMSRLSRARKLLMDELRITGIGESNGL